jgi:hypothetical protein
MLQWPEQHSASLLQVRNDGAPVGMQQVPAVPHVRTEQHGRAALSHGTPGEGTQHVPSLHGTLGAQTLPQPPQLLISILSSTQVPPQQMPGRLEDGPAVKQPSPLSAVMQVVPKHVSQTPHVPHEPPHPSSPH